MGRPFLHGVAVSHSSRFSWGEALEVSLMELAGLVNLSSFHFCCAFKESTVTSPHAGFAQRRIERAQEIMTAQPSMGLTEVAQCVGYSSQSASGTAFRRVTGSPPGVWRRVRLL